MEKSYKFDAFISYRHLPPDQDIAAKLQTYLEEYKPPRGRAYYKGRTKHIFRDTTELPTSGDLSADIKKALENSRFLIVICSKETKKSPWCLEEIEYFKELHNGNNDKILTLLVDGEPDEAFPDILRYETREYVREDGSKEFINVEVEPLAADVRPTSDPDSKRKLLRLLRMKFLRIMEQKLNYSFDDGSTRESLRLLQTQFLRIMAPILGCSFDDLFKRHHRRYMQRMIQLFISIIVAIILVSIYVSYNQNKLYESNLARQESELKATHEEITKGLIEAQNMITEGDKIAASRSLLDIKVKNDQYISDKNADEENTDDYVDLRIENMLYQSTYVPKYTQYAVLRSSSEYVTTEWIGDILYTPNAGAMLAAWNTLNGDLLWEKSTSTMITLLKYFDGYLYGITKEGTVLQIDPENGVILETFSFATKQIELSFVVYLDMLVGEDAIYILEQNTKSEFYQVICIDKSGQKDSTVLSFKAGTENVTQLKNCFFDKTRNQMIGILYEEKPDVIPDTNSVGSPDGNSEEILDVIPDEIPSGNYQCFSYHFSSKRRVDYKESAVHSDQDKIYYNEVLGQLLVMHQGDAQKPDHWRIDTYSTQQQKVVDTFTASNEDAEFFQFAYFRTACFSPDGQYMAIGEYRGNVILFDIKNQKVVGQRQTNTLDISILYFIDETCLYASSPSPDADSLMIYLNMENDRLITNEGYNKAKMMSNSSTVENTIGEAICTTNPTGFSTAIVNSNGEIYLYSLRDALIEKSLEAAEVIAYVSTEVSDGETIILAENADYIFEARQKPKPSTTDSSETSYWLVNKNSKEETEINLPFMAIACDIKDNQKATLLSEGYFLHEIDLKTGIISKTVKIHTDFNVSGILSSNSQTVTDLVIDYENEKPVAIVVKKYKELQELWKYRGIVVDYTTGDVLFEFSDVMRYMELGFDANTLTLYKLDPSLKKGIKLTVPAYENLMKIARKQIAGEWIA
ncbi:MAG: toll/interleukin-1 receptor domain-containing protein [Clostridium sp.]|jgi:WD40 repeat protein|nr:toll/interleukin-1 receptor domain-containing protein [Clostridium sp.]